MQRGMNIAALAAVATCVSVASADTVMMSFTGSTGLHNINFSGVDGSYNGQAGHLTHTIGGGGGSFNTFCIELAQTTGGGVYDIVDLAVAPSPGSPYGPEAATRVFEVLARAVELEWIDISLQADAIKGTSERMAAIQGAIWNALYGGVLGGSITSSDGNVVSALGTLNSESAESHLVTLMSNRVRAAVNNGAQDQLYVVPLPPAAWASLGLLGVCAGVRQARRRG